MQSLPLKKVFPGMFVQRIDEIPGYQFKPGRVTPEMIRWLAARGVQTVWVADECELGLSSLTEEVARTTELLNTFKKGMASLAHSLKLSNRMDMHQVREMCATLVDEVTLHKDIVLQALCLKDKDQYTYEHSMRVGIYATLLAQALGKSREEQVAYGTAGMMHDIGKLVIPARIIKKKGKLTKEEFRLIHDHPLTGRKLLAAHAGVSPDIVRAVGEHHERLDGKGYVMGLKGDQISLMGQVLGIVDTYDAITTDRPYKAAKSSYAAFREMRNVYATAYNLKLLDRFIQTVGIYAPGSVVLLSDGRYAVVAGNNPADLLRPWVVVYRVHTGPDGRSRYRMTEILHLETSDLSIEEVLEPGGDAYRAFAEHADGVVPGLFGGSA